MGTSESIGRLSAMSVDSDMPTLVQLDPDYPVPNSRPQSGRMGSMQHISSSSLGFSQTPPEPVTVPAATVQGRQGGAPLGSGEILIAHLPLGSQGVAPDGSTQLSPLLQPSMK